MRWERPRQGIEPRRGVPGSQSLSPASNAMRFLSSGIDTIHAADPPHGHPGSASSNRATRPPTDEQLRLRRGVHGVPGQPLRVRGAVRKCRRIGHPTRSEPLSHAGSGGQTASFPRGSGVEAIELSIMSPTLWVGAGRESVDRDYRLPLPEVETGEAISPGLQSVASGGAGVNDWRTSVLSCSWA